MLTTSIALAIFAALAYLLTRDKPASAASRPSIADPAHYLAPQPLKPRLAVDDWDGFHGLQAALCIKLADGEFLPVIEAGTLPPAIRSQTLSTAREEQESLSVALYAVTPGATNRATLVMELSIAPIPHSSEAIRQVELVCTVDEDGTVWVRAHDKDDCDVHCAEMLNGERRIAVGR